MILSQCQCHCQAFDEQKKKKELIPLCDEIEIRRLHMYWNCTSQDENGTIPGYRSRRFFLGVPTRTHKTQTGYELSRVPGYGRARNFTTDSFFGCTSSRFKDSNFLASNSGLRFVRSSATHTTSHRAIHMMHTMVPRIPGYPGTPGVSGLSI